MAKPQVTAAVRYMRTVGPLTRLIARDVLDIANVTAVISDIRRAGYKVEVRNKRDFKGRLYASYTLAPENTNA